MAFRPETGVSGRVSRLGGVPRAINSSLESERRGGRSTSRSHLIDAREANRIKKGGLRQHLQGGFAALIDGAATPPNLGGEFRVTTKCKNWRRQCGHHCSQHPRKWPISR